MEKNAFKFVIMGADNISRTYAGLSAREAISHGAGL